MQFWTFAGDVFDALYPLKEVRAAIRPIDLQDNLSKEPLAAREQHIQQTRPEMAQHNIARQQNQEHAHDHSRVRASEETDATENRVDDHDRRQQQQRRERRKQQEQKTANAPLLRPVLDGGGHIDITV
jgi:hypothetical protein